MKKLLYMLFAVCLALLLVSCSVQNTLSSPETEEPTVATENEAPTITDTNDPKDEKQPFDGKIAIISNSNSGADEEYNSAQMVVQKYGEKKFLHVTWPVLYEPDQMENVVAELCAEPDIKVVIVNRAVVWTNESFEMLKSARSDIFVIYINPEYDWLNCALKADMVLSEDVLGMGSAMVQQAYKMGAKTFVHYSFPRHMSNPIFAARYNQIKEECEKLRVEFVNLTALDYFYVSTEEAEQFILKDVPKIVEQYGEETAFFSTHCAVQASLIEAVVETSAIYPQPCCPSLYHGFPAALGIEVYLDGNLLPAQEIIEKIREALAAKNMLGRLSTWPESSSNLLTAASAEYAIKWINGEVPQKGVDVDLLKQLMMDYAGVEVYLTPYTDMPPYTEEGTGETYDNFLLMRMDYITF